MCRFDERKGASVAAGFGVNIASKPETFQPGYVVLYCEWKAARDELWAIRYAKERPPVEWKLATYDVNADRFIARVSLAEFPRQKRAPDRPRVGLLGWQSRNRGRFVVASYWDLATDRLVYRVFRARDLDVLWEWSRPWDRYARFSTCRVAMDGNLLLIGDRKLRIVRRAADGQVASKVLWDCYADVEDRRDVKRYGDGISQVPLPISHTFEGRLLHRDELSAYARDFWNVGFGICDATLTPDGSRIIAISADGRIREWDAKTLKEVYRGKVVDRVYGNDIIGRVRRW